MKRSSDARPAKPFQAGVANAALIGAERTVSRPSRTE
jgi:hypothetical protein